jgi:hypothetical protein
VGVVSLVRAERERPWSLVLDLVLLVGVLTWVSLRTTALPFPEAFAIYSALLVGAIVHRIFTVMDRR